MEIMFSALIINAYKHHVCLLDITITWERGKRRGEEARGEDWREEEKRRKRKEKEKRK